MKGFGILLLTIVTIFLAQNLQSARLQDYDIYEYDVRFTNPVCDTFAYTEEVFNRNGNRLLSKPKDSWCGRGDLERSASQAHSPQRKIIQWIRDPSTTEIFFAFLSFSNSIIFEELCAAVEERNVKIKFVIDQPEDENRIRYARRLEACQPLSGLEADKPELFLRGHVSGLGYAHNKVIIINPHSDHEFKVAYGSGNLSSGTVLHHENWHFVRTVVDSHFAQIHMCLKNGLENEATEGRRQFMRAIRDCRASIEFEEETDIKVFMAPGEHQEAEEAIMRHLEMTDELQLAAHRLSWGTLIDKLKEEMDREENPMVLKTVVDDDMYWIGQINEQLGPNSTYDYGKLIELIRAGATNRYMETNHNEFLLQHNKFLIFHMREDVFASDAVFAGAGNFTGAAFSTNLENYYFIEIPEVVESFKLQYAHMWNNLATEFMDMPLRNARAVRVRQED